MDFFNSLESKVKGALGEGITGAILYHLSLKGYSGYPYHNIYLPKGNGDYSEIDLAFVTKKGVFVFECKNYSGWIFGSEKDKYWTATYVNGEKKQFYNPVMQNEAHIRVLKIHIGSAIPCFSIVVFSDRCELKKISVNERQTKVLKIGDLFDWFSKIWETIPDTLPATRVEEISELIKKNTHVESDIKKQHIESIKRKKTAEKSKERNPKVALKKNSIDIMDLVSSTLRRL